MFDEITFETEIVGGENRVTVNLSGELRTEVQESRLTECLDSATKAVPPETSIQVDLSELTYVHPPHFEHVVAWLRELAHQGTPAHVIVDSFYLWQAMAKVRLILAGATINEKE